MCVCGFVRKWRFALVVDKQAIENEKLHKKSERAQEYGQPQAHTMSRAECLPDCSLADQKQSR